MGKPSSLCKQGKIWFAWKWSAASCRCSCRTLKYKLLIICDPRISKNITDSTDHFYYLLSYYFHIPPTKKFRWTTSAARNAESFESSFRQGRFQLSLDCANRQLWKEIGWKEKGKDKGKGKGKSKKKKLQKMGINPRGVCFFGCNTMIPVFCLG